MLGPQPSFRVKCILNGPYPSAIRVSHRFLTDATHFWSGRGRSSPFTLRSLRLNCWLTLAALPIRRRSTSQPCGTVVFPDSARNRYLHWLRSRQSAHLVLLQSRCLQPSLNNSSAIDASCAFCTGLPRNFRFRVRTKAALAIFSICSAKIWLPSTTRVASDCTAASASSGSRITPHRSASSSTARRSSRQSSYCGHFGTSKACGSRVAIKEVLSRTTDNTAIIHKS